ncbi:hypothetical protein GCK72_005667 [Caenorhabditis remanei]|uniref:Transmembrane protein 53 n=1 Tax=Caenorhabditis remanei TaxID=31234 RepID=A0A6A5HG61_CAERE|nr:hypothetical protein GCK72_005667 [Caenorhabditis remanei]KAF1765714.1 hypothetical protein GCK72_005667 [Caenorhabditis remanei]
MFIEAVAGLASAFVVTYIGMTLVAPSEITDKEAEDITTNKEESKKTGNEAAIKNLVPESKTLVVLFGWAGCRDRYLSKYAQYYQDAGISTVRFTAPIAKIRSFSSYRPFARCFHRILNEILEEKSDITTIYFHVFSMNGCSLLAAYWDQLNELENGKDIQSKARGLIFDSCPAFTTPSQSAHAISFATLPPSHYHGALRGSYRAVLYTFFSFHRGVLWLRSFLDKDIYEKHYAYFKMITFENLPTKQLYIYGPADLVCSEESIEDYAKLMEQRGISISKLRLLDSLHCQHLRSHPVTYTQECLDFVKSGHLPANRSRVPLENTEGIEQNDVPEELAY